MGINKLLRSQDISVCNGGTLLELSEHQDKAEELFTELVDIGCDFTEISSGSLDIDSDRVVDLINNLDTQKISFSYTDRTNLDKISKGEIHQGVISEIILPPILITWSLTSKSRVKFIFKVFNNFI